MNSNNKIARTAGLLYLIVAICGGFSLMYIPFKFIVWNDAAATVSNIVASESLFRIGFVSGLISMMCFILLPLALYLLLKQVNRNHAMLMVIFALMSVPISCINIVSQFAALKISTEADYMHVFESNQLNALVLLFIDLYNTGNLINHIFWGLWLLPLGFLVYKSGFLPRILGVLLMIGCFGYLISFFVHSLFPEHVETTSSLPMISGIAEISFCLWLLIRGVNLSKMNPSDNPETAS